jgi:hypothetical protein
LSGTFGKGRGEHQRAKNPQWLGGVPLYFASRSLFKNTDTPVFKVCLQVWNPPGPSLASLGPSVLFFSPRVLQQRRSVPLIAAP